MGAARRLVYTLFGSETLVERENEISGIRAAEMDTLRGLSGVKGMDKILKACVREFCRMEKDLNERINECVHWFLKHIWKEWRTVGLLKWYTKRSKLLFKEIKSLDVGLARRILGASPGD